jgi:outer membrane lipoprotein-sorting protein
LTSISLSRTIQYPDKPEKGDGWDDVRCLCTSDGFPVRAFVYIVVYFFVRKALRTIDERRLKMGKRVLFGWGMMLLVVAVILVLSGSSIAAEFSADLLLKQGGKTMTGKVYVKGDKTRQEFVQQGQKQITILRPDKGITWVLMPAEKIYMEMSSQEGAAYDPQLDLNIKDKAEIKLLGKETVNGYMCDKYQYIYRDTSMGTATQWVSKQLNVPIKTEYKSTSGYMLTEYKNIKEGNIQDSLFEVPGDYALLSLPGMR